MLKKISCTLLTIIMILTFFIGCGKKEDVNEKEVTSQVVSEEGMIGNMYIEGLPIVKDKVTLKMVGIQGAQTGEFDKMPFFKKLEEKTNINIEWDLYPLSSYPEKKNILIATNELPDAFFGPNAFKMEDANKYGPDGTVIPLDDLIDKYAPNYKVAMEQMPILDGMTTAFDGHKYTMGTVVEQEIRNFPDNIYINKTWLDKLGLEVPTTVEEYYEVLKAFRDNDPNENGKQDEIPFTFLNFNHITGYGSLFGAFGRAEMFNYGGNPIDHFVVEDGEVVFTANKPEYKEAINYFHKFFKEDLFDKEGFTQDPKQFTAKLQDPQVVVGSFFGWAAGAAGPNSDYFIPIAPLKGPNGEEPATKRRNNHINVMASGFAITPNNKYPEITMRWVDEFYDKLTSVEAQYGPVKVGLQENGNNTYTFIEEAPEGKSYVDMWHEYAPFDQSPKFIPADTFGTYIPINPQDQQKMNVINKYYKGNKINDGLPIINFTEEETNMNSTIGLDIGNYVKDNQAKWLLKGTIDSEWDAYLEKLNKLKLDDFIISMQKAYDRTAGK